MRLKLSNTNTRRVGCLGILLIYAAAYTAIALLLFGCTRTVYMPVESANIHTDSARVSVNRIDSVVIRDSVTLIQRGDTVFHTVVSDRYLTKYRVDTVFRVMIDSIRVTVPVPVERKLTRWERIKIDYGGHALSIVGAVLVFAIVWLVIKCRNKI